MDVPADVFETHVRYLTNHHRVVSMSELVRMEDGASWGEDVAVITFDDGYEDVYSHAYPILLRYKIPAVVYLATEFIETGRPFPWTPDWARPMSWEQVRTMVASGLVEVGSHTHSHPNLGRLDPDGIERELSTSRQLLAQRLGMEIVHFSYPMPSRVPGSFCPPEADRLARRHFRSAVAGGYAKNYPPLSVYNLARVSIQRSDTDWLFRSALRGYLAPYARLSAFAHGLRSIDAKLRGARAVENVWR